MNFHRGLFLSFRFIGTFALLSLIGCNSVRHELFLDKAETEQKRKVTLSTEYRKATLGDEMLSEGDYKRMPSLELLTPIKASIPGAGGLPFTFSIDNCVLTPSWKSKNYNYYEAPSTRSTATHALLGTVVKGDDKIGVRVHRQNNGMEWYVDNSNYNSSRSRTWIWSRAITNRDNVKFRMREDKSILMTEAFTQIREITYGGFANGNYTLTFREVNEAREYEKDFLIPKAKNGVTQVSIKGSLIEILSHSNLDVTFRVLRTFTR